MTDRAAEIINHAATVDGIFHVRRTQNVDAILQQTQDLRSNEMTGTADHRHVGRIPAVLLEQWLQEAGITLCDSEAVQDLIARKLSDGDNSKLRVYEGTFR